MEFFLKFITLWFKGAPAIEKGIADKIKEIKEQTPKDLHGQIEQLHVWLTGKLSEEGHDVSKMFNVIRGICTDLIMGTAGVNKQAWMTSV